MLNRMNQFEVVVRTYQIGRYVKGLTMKKLTLLLLALTSVACATGYNPDYYYNEVQVVNLTGATITQVNLQVGGTERTLSCDQVLNNALCADRFGRRYYPQQLLDLSWVHGDGRQMSQQVAPKIQVYFSPAFALRIMLEIQENGAVKTYVEQDEPGRNGGNFISH